MFRILKLFLNKYVITLIAFIVWMTFFDQNDWMTQKETRKLLEDTKLNIQQLEKLTNETNKEYYDIVNNPNMLEKVAREKYKMKKSNEDLYIIGN